MVFLQRRVAEARFRACVGACVCEGREADGTCLISLSQRNETGTGLTNLQARLMARDTAPTQTGGGGGRSPLQR